MATKRATTPTHPTVDEYFSAHATLRGLLRRAFDKPGSVKGSELRKALEVCEKADRKAAT